MAFIEVLVLFFCITITSLGSGPCITRAFKEIAWQSSILRQHETLENAEMKVFLFIHMYHGNPISSSFVGI
jgi:hypothetical protein